MTAVIVQCRLSSTRLPGKALADLGGVPALEWTLLSMKKVRADAYCVATDEASLDALAPVAARRGFEIFAGPLEDVLARFCAAARKIGADTIVRATADNPFLFHEAAQSLLDEFFEREKNGAPDYITWTGLPHGAGVEVMDAAALLRANDMTDSAYEREHVGPAIYNHPDKFSALFLPAPARFRHPEYRVTIDTPRDLRGARSVVKFLSLSGAEPPYSTEQILLALKSAPVARPVLFAPTVERGRGTGHLRRCLSAAAKIGAFVLIPDGCAGRRAIEDALCGAKKEGFEEWQATRDFPEKGEYSLIVADRFKTDGDEARLFRERAPIAALDEGGRFHESFDCLVDIIPSIYARRKANVSDARFIETPSETRKGPPVESAADIRRALVCFGGEDPARLALPAAKALAGDGIEIDAVSRDGGEEINGVNFVGDIPLLREKLPSYDLVVTHYGLTAFEAAAAGCAVILCATTPLHLSLAKKNGFACLKKNEIDKKHFDSLLSRASALRREFSPAGKKSLGDFAREISNGARLDCPFCASDDGAKDKVIARTPSATFRRCRASGLVYMSWRASAERAEYGESYFGSEYKKQYGKSYIEDFDSIKKQGERRVREIDRALRLRAQREERRALLDVGCAYGPFLSAASDDGWQVFGVDACAEAVSYVQSALSFPASRALFPDFDCAREFGVARFDAVTMWFTIEHFKNLRGALAAVSSLLKDGGIFAFSTPSLDGVSARFSRDSFFAASPSDHFTIWSPSSAARVLKAFGFSIVKTVSTGHHAERFPFAKKRGLKEGSAALGILGAASRAAGLGDTFEVYCEKTGGIG